MADKLLKGIILAGGIGQRLNAPVPKPLLPLGDRPLLMHAIHALHGLCSSITIVASKQLTEHPEFTSEIMAKLPSTLANLQVALQPVANGTGGALQIAQLHNDESNANVVVGCVDVPLISPSTIKKMLKAHTTAGSLMTILSNRTDNTKGLGRVVRDTDNLPTRIAEDVDALDDLALIDEVNVGWYCFDGGWVWEALTSLLPATCGELRLTDALALAASRGRANVLTLSNQDEGLGINTLSELATAEKVFRRQQCERLMANGVIITDPDTTYVDASVQVGVATKLLPGTHLKGNTTIGSKCSIGPNAIISDSILGEQTTVENACVEGSNLGAESVVGHFSRLRTGTLLESGARIGNHAEIKNSRIGSGTHIGHFSFVGDSQVGAAVNIGAGAVTCNFDGATKHSTTIGNNAFIGSGVMLVAPVTIGQQACIGAGAVVVKDVAPLTTVAGVPAKTIHPRSLQQ